MSDLKYLGGAQNPSDVLTAKGIQSKLISPVSRGDVEAAVAAYVGSSLLSRQSFDRLKANYQTNSYIETKKEDYLSSSEIGTPNGPAPLDLSGRLDTRHVYTTNTSQQWRHLRTIAGLPGASITDISVPNHTPRVVSGITIPDPGFPYFPIFFGNFSMSGTGFLVIKRNGKVFARAAHTFMEGRSGTSLIPANTESLTGDFVGTLEISAQQDSMGQKQIVAHSGGIIVAFAAPSTTA